MTWNVGTFIDLTLDDDLFTVASSLPLAFVYVLGPRGVDCPAYHSVPDERLSGRPQVA
jgi:hypothetical protein